MGTWGRRASKVFRVFRLLITLKFSRNAKVARALADRRPVRPAADDDF